MADAVEVAAFDVVGGGTAIADVDVYVRERSEQGASFGGEGLIAAAACAMQPPDLSLGMLVRQRVKHGEQWSRADAGADQEHWPARRVEDEGTARRGDLDLVADFQAGVQIAARRPAGFALDADPVVAGAGRPGERVIAEDRPVIVVGLDTQREVLTRARGGYRCAVEALEADGDNRVALSLDAGDDQRAETGPGRWRTLCRQAGVAAAGLSFEEGSKRALPARAEGGDSQRSEQLLPRVPGEIEKRVDLGDRHLLRT